MANISVLNRAKSFHHYASYGSTPAINPLVQQHQSTSSDWQHPPPEVEAMYWILINQLSRNAEQIKLMHQTWVDQKFSHNHTITASALLHQHVAHSSDKSYS
jgi:hypothetical protein